MADEAENLEETVVEEDGEPGGKNPLEVARRIEYGKRKAAEKRLEDAERRAIAAEAQARLLAEQQEKAKEQPAEKQYTRKEVMQFVREGKLERDLANDYIKLHVEPVEMRELLAAEKQKEAAARPIELAKAEMADWLAIMPALKDDSSPEAAKAAAELDKLIGRGFPDSWPIKLIAIEKAHGSIEAHKKKQEMRELTRQGARLPVDGSGGGEAKTAKVTDISKAPEHMVKYWEANVMSPKEREGHFKLWQQAQAKK